MRTKISNPTRVMVLVRRVSRCSVALDGFDNHRRSQDDGNDLGDEDLTPYEDRKPGSSKNFDSFEIFSSEMTINSPRFFMKSVDDSGDDNKSRGTVGDLPHASTSSSVRNLPYSRTGASILRGASSTGVLGGEIINSRRDHNRGAFIISTQSSYLQNVLIIGEPLDLGGSDSNTSRSTLAVSDPSASGTVGDLRHASTSSSVGDLPCSTPSSASNREQSLLEEFIASTDSGTYVLSMVLQ